MNRFRELRKERHLTQAELIKLYNTRFNRTYSIPALSLFENGHRLPELPALKDFAELFDCSVDYLIGRTSVRKPLLGDINDATHPWYPYINELPPPTDNIKIPIIGSVKCGYNGLAYEYLDGYVMIDNTKLHGDIKAFRCRGDSMNGLGIFDGDIALVRVQEDVDCGELAIVIVDGDEGMLKRIRKQEGAIILESANPAYPPRVFTGEAMNKVRVVGKVVEIRRSL